MNIQEKPFCLLTSQNAPTISNRCPIVTTEGATAMTKQEGSDSEMARLHWSGQPGEDLFFNKWKLMF